MEGRRRRGGVTDSRDTGEIDQVERGGRENKTGRGKGVGSSGRRWVGGKKRGRGERSEKEVWREEVKDEGRRGRKGGELGGKSGGGRGGEREKNKGSDIEVVGRGEGEGEHSKGQGERRGGKRGRGGVEGRKIIREGGRRRKGGF